MREIEISPASCAAAAPYILAIGRTKAPLPPTSYPYNAAPSVDVPYPPYANNGEDAAQTAIGPPPVFYTFSSPEPHGCVEVQGKVERIAQGHGHDEGRIRRQPSREPRHDFPPEAC